MINVSKHNQLLALDHVDGVKMSGQRLKIGPVLALFGVERRRIGARRPLGGGGIARRIPETCCERRNLGMLMGHIKGNPGDRQRNGNKQHRPPA